MRSWNIDDILSSLSNPSLASNFTDMGPQVPDISEQPPIIQKKPMATPKPAPEPQAMSLPAPEQAGPQVDVNDYLMQKNKIGKYSDENRQALVDENSKYDLGGNAMAALAALGAGFQGRDAAAAGSGVLARNKGERAEKLTQFDKGRDNEIQQLKLDREGDNFDPMSERSMAFKKAIESNFPEIAKAYGKDWANVSAADQDAIFKPLQLKETIDSRKQSAEAARDERRFLAGMKNQEREDVRNEKLDEKMLQLGTPYGTAITADDAKNLKGAHEAKSNFDSKIKEMIDLRKEYGTEYMNREAVERGKQLSKDLLLEYKNMAKLGVLSQSDEAIINAIIPADPLGQDWAPGQDPILHRLEKFKGDSDKDFANRVQTRIRGGKPTLVGEGQASQGGDKDQKALDWAKANPNDPRAAKIMQRLGM